MHYTRIQAWVKYAMGNAVLWGLLHLDGPATADFGAMTATVAFRVVEQDTAAERVARIGDVADCAGSAVVDGRAPVSLYGALASH
jgi:hypothetical protein